MYEKPKFDGYSRGKVISFKDQENKDNSLTVYNFLLGILDFKDYIIRVFTMSFNDIGKYPPYLLLTKDYKSNNRQGKMVCLSIIKPEYIKLDSKYHTFALTKEECKVLYDFMCSYNYHDTFYGYLDLEYCDKSYTQYSNYIYFLNGINKDNENWREIPLDTGCPKYTTNMDVYKEKKEINNNEYNG